MLLLLEQFSDEALAQLPPDRHAAYAAAFEAALRLDPAMRADELEAFGFSLKDAYACRLGLLKPLAYDLLRESLEISRAAFERRHDWRLYRERAGAEPAYVNAKLKVMLLTPGEWAWLAGLSVSALPLPPRVKALRAVARQSEPSSAPACHAHTSAQSPARRRPSPARRGG